MTGALRRDAYVLPGQTVSVRRIYKLLLLMLPGKVDWPPESPDNQYHLNK